ncbi:hypothetical protein B0A54_08281 [Friedmanniomyces endolithicus]|uniref:Uncharacterized protein n=1 Tax=Friedmanniomyces endolithicus TaxID=329885 RepID=A0A4U0V052_9PEZI|nr:hypothetical protein B0A54_08281 [Friedmanniomyces endolithicus]
MQRDYSLTWPIQVCEQGGYLSHQGYDITPTRSILPSLQLLLHSCRASHLSIFHTREGHRPDLSSLTQRELFRSRNNPSGLGIGDRGPLGRLLVRGEAGHVTIPELYPLDGEPVVDKPGKGASAVPVKGPTSTEDEPVPVMWGTTDVVRVVLKNPPSPTLTEDGTLIGSAVGTADSVVLRVVTLPLCDITGLMVTVLKTWAVLGANVWGAVFADDATVDVIVVVVLGGGTKRENMGAVDASVIELVKVLVFVE